MHTPSPQLLRALRTSVSTTTTTTTTAAALRRTASPISQIAPRCSTLPSFSSSSNTLLPSTRRHNSNQTPRPTRMIPRSHAHKPSAQREREPEGSENRQADLNALNVLGDIPAPTTAVDATLDDGFHLDNGVKIRNGDGALLVSGEAFAWRPWLKRPSGSKAEMINKKGQFEVDEEVWGLLGLVWPRPGKLSIPHLDLPG